MGSELYRMIRDGAPASWTTAMRLVAWAIADDARDPSQGLPEDGGWPWSALPVRGSSNGNGAWKDGLTERTGLKEHTIHRALADLGAADYEMREKVTTDKRGRPMFACRGHAVRFRVPVLTPRQSPPDLGDQTSQSPPDLGDLTAGAQQRKVSQIRRLGEPNLTPSPPKSAHPVSPGLPKVFPDSEKSVGDGSLEGDHDGQVGDFETELHRQQRELAEWMRAHPEPADESWAGPEPEPDDPGDVEPGTERIEPEEPWTADADDPGPAEADSSDEGMDADEAPY